MEFTNDILKRMDIKKKAYNIEYSKWYYSMSLKYIENVTKYENRSERIANCMNLWEWDKYEKNKILDLQRVNRCSNNRFCPNCKLLDISKFIHSFRNIYENLCLQGYKAYMLTLTIPSVAGENLSDTISLLNKKFLKFMQKFSYSDNDKRSFSDRLIKIDGGIKVLEITYNKLQGFHPHFHCIVFVKNDIDDFLLKKRIKGKYSNKLKKYHYKSYIDLQLAKIWSMIWYDERLTIKNYESIDFNLSQEYFKKNKKVLEVDFRSLDESGIYEVFKYTFKDTDIENYYVFETLVKSLENKRIRQGFGILYNFKCEDIEDGEIQSLELEVDENPVHLLTYEINELISTYKDYKKISRFNKKIDENII